VPSSASSVAPHPVTNTGAPAAVSSSDSASVASSITSMPSPSSKGSASSSNEMSLRNVSPW
jgi:hypothetical protein